jgi:tetratricopeptide (TPR) repeat protein
MFLQPPEELAGPTWSLNIVPSFSAHVLEYEEPTPAAAPGFLSQARAAVEKHPDSPAALARLAQAAQAAGAIDEAVEHARRAIDRGLDETAFGAVHAAMTLLAASGQSRDAIALVDDRRAESVPVGIRVRAAAAAGEFDAAQHLPCVDTSPDALSVITWIRTEQGDFQGAIRAGRQAERGGAAGVTLYANLGFAHAAVGNLQKAVRLARQARGLSPFDRRLAFTLARYLQLAGDAAGGIAVLESLRDGDRVDVELALALAKALTDSGKVAEAHRVLQRARASQEWAIADNVSRAELTANLALLRWITRRDRAESSLKEILRALQSSDYQSLGVAYLLLNLMRTPAHADDLARVIGRLETQHPATALHGLRMLLAILRRDAEDAIRQSEAWTKQDLFNAFAASAATMLVGEVGGNFSKASEIGLAALSRMPTDILVVNNTAFVLAMDRQLDAAQKLIDRGKRSDRESVYLTATQGLIDLMSGSADLGRARYQRAEAQAKARGDEALAARVALYAAFAERAAGVDPILGDPEKMLAAEATEQWIELPGFWVARERLCRERGTLRRNQ